MQKSRVGIQKNSGFLKIDVTAANQAEPNVIVPHPLTGSPDKQAKIQIVTATPNPATNEALMQEIGVSLQNKRVRFFI